MTQSHRYRHYGLLVEANVALPATPEPGSGHADVRVAVTRAHERPLVEAPWAPLPSQSGVWRLGSGDATRLRLQFADAPDSWADLVIDEHGEDVRLTLSESADLDDACELLMAAGFTCVLIQRGVTCLHASVVAIEGRAIALVGDKGAGKSTLALALARAGARLVSDDVAALMVCGGSVAVAPGPMSLRMRPDSAAHLGNGLGAQRPVWLTAPPDLVKQYYEVGGTGERRSVPLAGVFLLTPRGGTATPAFRTVAPGELLPVLLANRHMLPVLDAAAQRRDFACLGVLVRAIPGRELHRPDDLTATAAVAEAVIAEASRLPALGPTTRDPPGDAVRSARHEGNRHKG